MLSLVSRDWWVYAIRGIAAIVFGILALVWPGPTLAVLVLLFGAYAFVDGVTLLVALARGDVLARRHKWATALMGALGIIASIVALVWPGMTALTLLYLVAIWAISTGFLQIVAAIEFRREIDGEGWMVLGGILSIVFGGLLVAFPGSGLVTLVWMVGFWAELFGFSSLGVAHRLRGIDRDLNKKARLQNAGGVA
ncbi:MAG TPA: HdeD family acid-resistance protein [Candidatus Limnocylindrales bacterium]